MGTANRKIHLRQSAGPFQTILAVHAIKTRECIRNIRMSLSLRTVRSLISSFCANGRVGRAIKVMELAIDKGVGCPLDGTSVGLMIDAAVDGFCKHGNAEAAIGFFTELQNKGLMPDQVRYMVLVQGFCRRGRLQEAMSVCNKMQEMGMIVDDAMHSTLVYGFCRKGDISGVSYLLKELPRKGFKPGAAIYVSAISGLCRYRKMFTVDEFAKGENPLYGILIHGFLKEVKSKGLLEVLRILNEGGVNIDAATCNVLIKALFQNGMTEDAYLLFRRMPEMGLVADSVIYCTVVDEYCKLGVIDRALEVFDEYKKASVSIATCHSCIIRGLCKEGMFDSAIEVFQDILLRGLLPDSATCKMLMKLQFKVSGEDGILKLLQGMENVERYAQCIMYNDCITYLHKKGCFETALNLYLFMKREGLRITSKSYYTILINLFLVGNVQLAEPILSSYIKEFGMFGSRTMNIISLYLFKRNTSKALDYLKGMQLKEMSAIVSRMVVDCLKNEGRVQDANKFVAEAEENGADLDAVTYSIVVDGLCREGYLKNALEVCTTMRQKGIHPNIVTYNSVIYALCQQGCLVEAFRLFDSLEQNNIYPTVVTFGTLLDALSREGFLEDANKLFERMLLKDVTPNIHVYNTLIFAHSRFGLMEESMKFLDDLEQNNLKPDAFTISALISGFCVKGDLEHALGFYAGFQGQGISPDFFGFCGLIKGLSAKGRMEEARNIFRDMLHCQSVIHLINRTGDGVDVDSLANLLGSLCEEGRIKDAIGLLSEIGCHSFPSMRSINRPRNLKKLHQIEPICTVNGKSLSNNHLVAIEQLEHDTDCSHSMPIPGVTGDPEIGFGSMRKEGSENYETSMRKLLQHDFDTYYSIIASLCSKGELQKARDIVKSTLLNYR